MINLYWPVYKNLEHEVVELSNKIHIDDQQLTVYSVKISELLIRCVVEIEAISKELYFKNGGKQPSNGDLYFDTDCLDYLEKKWALSEKKVIASSVSFYFSKDENKVLTPLKRANKRGDSGAEWKKAYQAVKHDRTGNLQKGNLKSLLRAMSALFVLNLYYRDDRFDLMDQNTDSFAESFSDLFNVKVHKWQGGSAIGKPYKKNIDFDECVFLIKYTDEFHMGHKHFAKELNKHLNKLIYDHPKVKEYINNNIIENGNINEEKLKYFLENREALNLIDMKTEYGGLIRIAEQKATEITGFSWKNPRRYEALLNMNQEVYP